MNEGTLIGFISSDIKGEDINLKSGEKMRKVSFSVACNRKGKNAGADFPWLIAFGKTAEVIEQYLGRGKGVIAKFHVQTSSYTNKEGKKIYQTDLVCDSIEFPPLRKDEQAANEPQPETPESQPEQQAADSSSEGFMDIPMDDDSLADLPFRKR